MVIHVLPCFILCFIALIFIRLMQNKNWSLAYKNMPYERKACCNEHDISYLKQRPFWQFLNYIRSNA
jgi:nuclear transport factor 2 (NTF2) superfamily protein